MPKSCGYRAAVRSFFFLCWHCFSLPGLLISDPKPVDPELDHSLQSCEQKRYPCTMLRSCGHSAAWFVHGEDATGSAAPSRPARQVGMASSSASTAAQPGQLDGPLTSHLHCSLPGMWHRSHCVDQDADRRVSTSTACSNA